MKKWIKVLLCIVLAAVLTVGGYVAYVFIDYHRIGDMPLTPVQSAAAAAAAQADTPYTVVSWNIGFGAYEDDYGFFMDGGTQSRAWSKERLTANMDAIAAFLKAQEADFCFVQEVDTDSTRSYHVDEREYLYAAQPDYDSAFAVNYDSPFLFYPLLQPHGASRSGLLMMAGFSVTDAVRRSLPVESGLTKLLDLDRCYSVSRVPVEGGKELCLYDLHLSAYSSDGTIADELTGPVVKLAEGEFAVTIRKIKRLMTAAVTHGIELRALRRASRQKRRKKSGRKDSQKMFPIHSIRQLWVRQVFNIRCTFRNRGHSPIGQESNNYCLRNSYRIGTSFRRELFFRPAPHRRPPRFRVSPPPNKSAHPSRLVPRICRISRGPPSQDRQYRHRFRENES